MRNQSAATRDARTHFPHKFQQTRVSSRTSEEVVGSNPTPYLLPKCVFDPSSVRFFDFVDNLRFWVFSKKSNNLQFRVSTIFFKKSKKSPVFQWKFYINPKEISLLWKIPGKELWGFTDRLYMTSSLGFWEPWVYVRLVLWFVRTVVMFQTPFFGPWEPWLLLMLCTQPVLCSLRTLADVVAVYRAGSLVTENRLYMSTRSNLGESLVGV